MKAEELRIGNFVNNDEEVFSISYDENIELSYDTPEKGSSYYTDNIINIKPIPLTEKWLLKFGFNNIEYLKAINHNYIKGNFKFNSAVLWIAEYKGIHIENKILYVHQLQNLYFVLTGEELKLKN